MALGGCASAPTFKSNAPAPAVNTARTPVVVGDIDPLVQQEYDNALTLMSVEDYDGAAQILQPFVARHAEFPAAATLLAVALRKTDRVQAAFDIAQQTVALYPDYAPALNEVGILHRERGEFEQSEAAYLKAVTVRPDYA
ncbi:MAG: tetratricopeptide repeat protein, partial [Pseudomonadota bacterium]